MRAFVRPLAGALSIACLTAAIALLSNGSALAQAKQTPMNQMATPQAAPPPMKQMALTDKQIEGVLAAQNDIDAIIEKLPENAKPDPKVVAQLEAVAKKNGFASYDEYTNVVENISLVLAGFDPATKKYVGSDAVIKSQIVESNHTIEIDKFVPREQIDERYFDNPYYLLPNDQVGQEAFAVIREAMRGKGMVALGRVVLSKRERIIMLQPWGKGVMGATLRYGYEVRDQKDFFDDLPDVKIAPDMLKLAAAYPHVQRS
jgi:hypothetical protein